MAQPRKVLALDVDGVVLHHPRVLDHVSRRICSYVRDHVPGRLNLMEAAALNELLYKSYGHTHRGLQRVYGAAVPPLEHFQKTIYDGDVQSLLWDRRHDPMMQMRAADVHRLLEHAARHDVPVYLFSNAPKTWCHAVADVLQLGIPHDNVLCSGHPVFLDTLLKPDAKLFENVATFIDQSHRSDGPATVVFVDDSWNNLAPLVGQGGWAAVFLSPDGPRVQSKYVRTVSKLSQVAPMLLD
jgi:FMN phosphatase YigB (HAD superfamily)